MTETTMSPTVNEIFAALAKAQGKIQPASKDKANPFFKSKYADLSSVWDACRDALSDNGLSIVQFPLTKPEGLCLVSLLGHSSGQWIRSEVLIPLAKNDPQTTGSALTYFRRYSLSALVGVAPEDDDGEKAQAPFRNKGGADIISISKISKDQGDDLKNILDECDPNYKAWFYNYIRNQYKTENVADIPADVYPKMKAAAIKNMEKTHELQKVAHLLPEEAAAGAQ